MEPVNESVTTTTTTDVTDSGSTTVEKVEHEYTPQMGHHCTCEECQQWEDDIAERLALIEERLSGLSVDSSPTVPPSADDDRPTSEPASETPPEAPKGETVVQPTAEIETKREKKHAGWLF